MVCVVPKISLSIVPGIPIIGNLYSSLKMTAPVNDPSPPITTIPSISFSFKFWNAFARPSFVLNSLERADFKIVPPLLIILFTLLAVNSIKSPSISPS